MTPAFGLVPGAVRRNAVEPSQARHAIDGRTGCLVRYADCVADDVATTKHPGICANRADEACQCHELSEERRVHVANLRRVSARLTSPKGLPKWFLNDGVAGRTKVLGTPAPVRPGRKVRPHGAETRPCKYAVRHGIGAPGAVLCSWRGGRAMSRVMGASNPQRAPSRPLAASCQRERLRTMAGWGTSIFTVPRCVHPKPVARISITGRDRDRPELPLVRSGHSWERLALRGLPASVVANSAWP